MIIEPFHQLLSNTLNYKVYFTYSTQINVGLPYLYCTISYKTHVKVDLPYAFNCYSNVFFPSILSQQLTYTQHLNLLFYAFILNNRKLRVVFMSQNSINH